MSEIKLSGEFQPNVYFDFGQGKIFCNRWAQGFVHPPFYPQEADNPLYVYAEDDNGNLYNTGYICPRCASCIDPEVSANVKVDITRNFVSIDTYPNPEYGGIWDNYTGEYIANLRNAGINYFSKSPKSVDDLLEDTTIRPTIVFMPLVRDIVKNTVSYAKVDKVDEGDLFTVAVLPCADGEPSKNDFLILCADKRLFIPQSYKTDGEFKRIFIPDENVMYYENNEKVENVDDYSCKFRVNGKFVNFLYLSAGSMVCLRTVVDTFNIRGVDTKVTYWEVDNALPMQEVNFTKDVFFYHDSSELHASIEMSMDGFASNPTISLDRIYPIYVNTFDNPESFENSIMFNQDVL